MKGGIVIGASALGLAACTSTADLKSEYHRGWNAGYKVGNAEQSDIVSAQQTRIIELESENDSISNDLRVSRKVMQRIADNNRCLEYRVQNGNRILIEKPGCVG